MRRVALISQTLRAQHCRAYLDDGLGEDVILTSNPEAFTDLGFDTPTNVVAISPPPELLPPRHLAHNRIFRSALSRARSGSRLGARLERMAKPLARRLRDLRGLIPWRRPPRQIGELSIRSSAMYAKLQEEHAAKPIEQLVVFDLFDLPVALAFAETHDVEVLVR